MKYWLFERSAAEELVTRTDLQSYEYELSKQLIAFLQGKTDIFTLTNIVIEKDSNGIIFAGPQLEKKIIVIDLEQCHILDKTTDIDLLLIIQKLLRFAIRYWGQQSFTSAENIVDDKAIIFPFPYSTKKAYRIAVAREPECRRLHSRGISFSLLAYKYNDQGAPKDIEKPSTTIYQKAGETYLEQISTLRGKLSEPAHSTEDKAKNHKPLHLVGAGKLTQNAAFKFMPFETQLPKLTISQQEVVNQNNIKSPIRVEGPAGTGKTISLVMRAARLLQKFREESHPFKVAFFAHSKTTEDAIKLMFRSTTNDLWENDEAQNIEIITLQEYCARFIQLSDTQIIDGDAYEAKQYQLLVIQDIYKDVSKQFYRTYRPHLSEQLKNILDNEEEARIVNMLQHEFSVQIKGYAEDDFESYKKLRPISNGLPVTTEDDKTYIYLLFSAYQDYLRRSSVFDTDDVVLEAMSRFRGPLWKRERLQKGVDYIFIDEMHLFNANEQQVFHQLTKKVEQEEIPLCFALDYSQSIGDQGELSNTYIEKNLTKYSISQKYGTVFRSSQEIAELCASITCSGAALFSGFINPYPTATSGFTAKEEQFCQFPTLYMYNSDTLMLDSLKTHVNDMIKTFQCSPSEIAIILFGYTQSITASVIAEKSGHQVLELVSKNSITAHVSQNSKVVFSTPENINGLEFNGVILLGVDEGRVPAKSSNDISENFLRYRALNQLYLSCSRARFQVRILGNRSKGVSSCLNYSLKNGTLVEHKAEKTK